MARSLDFQVIDGAYKLLSDKERWTWGHFASTADGKRCQPYDREAVRWCLVGAILRSAYDLTGNVKSAVACILGVRGSCAKNGKRHPMDVVASLNTGDNGYVHARERLEAYVTHG